MNLARVHFFFSFKYYSMRNLRFLTKATTIQNCHKYMILILIRRTHFRRFQITIVKNRSAKKFRELQNWELINYNRVVQSFKKLERSDHCTLKITASILNKAVGERRFSMTVTNPGQDTKKAEEFLSSYERRTGGYFAYLKKSGRQ